MTLLSLQAVRAGYGNSEVLHGIDLDVAAGGTTALLGANGAGKTTTLRAISGLVARRGRISFDGRDISGMSTDAVAKLGRSAHASLGFQEPPSVRGYDQPHRMLRQHELLEQPNRVRRARCPGDREHERRMLRHGVAHWTRRSARTNAKNVMLMIPFMVKNAASRRDRSPSRTSECS